MLGLLAVAFFMGALHWNSMSRSRHWALLVFSCGMLFAQALLIIPMLYLMYKVSRPEGHAGTYDPTMEDKSEHTTLDYKAIKLIELIYKEAGKYRGKLWKDHLHNFNVPRFELEGAPSRGYKRLDDILKKNKYLSKRYDNVVELGVGRGGWTSYLHDHNMCSNYLGVSRWKQEGQEPLNFRPMNKNYHLLSKDIRHLAPRKVDLLLTDFGEGSNTDHEGRTRNTHGVLDLIEPWLALKPKSFIVRLPCGFSDQIIDRLEGIESKYKITGKLFRAIDERNADATLYYISSPTRSNLRRDAQCWLEEIYLNVEEGLLTMPEVVKEEEKVGFPKFGTIPVPRLQCPDLTESLKDYPGLHPSHYNPFKFLKLIGVRQMPETGSSASNINDIVKRLTAGLSNVLIGKAAWRTTSTLTKDTYTIIMDKIDKAPVEDSAHHGYLWEGYQALADYMIEKKVEFGYSTQQEIYEGANRNGAMGYQEAHLGYRRLGEYLDSDQWWPRVQTYLKSLRKGKPILSIFNSTGKKEKKTKAASRLVWFLPATPRLAEAHILGKTDNLCSALPYSVSKMPLYDYGDALKEIFTKDKCAIAEDIAGWDTKVSHAVLSMECAFLQRISKEMGNAKQHQDDIRSMYEIYAYPTVAVMRHIDGDESKDVEQVIVQSQGQVPSGKRPTYPMNTITNTALTITKAAYSQGVKEKNVRAWVLARLREGHSDRYGGKISGDDSAIIMHEYYASKYAAAQDYNNSLGFVRKDVEANKPSILIDSMEDLEFCSHTYIPVQYHNQGERVEKYMPTRPARDIIAKATIMIGRQNNTHYQKAWARAQALTMLVNYHHIPCVRMLAFALFASTPANIAITDDVKLGWTMRDAPWIKPGDPVDIVNECLFGTSSTRPKDFRISEYRQMGHLKRHARRRFEVNWRDRAYIDWKRFLIHKVQKERNICEREGFTEFEDQWVEELRYMTSIERSWSVDEAYDDHLLD